MLSDYWVVGFVWLIWCQTDVGLWSVSRRTGESEPKEINRVRNALQWVNGWEKRREVMTKALSGSLRPSDSLRLCSKRSDPRFFRVPALRIHWSTVGCIHSTHMLSVRLSVSVLSLCLLCRRSRDCNHTNRWLTLRQKSDEKLCENCIRDNNYLRFTSYVYWKQCNRSDDHLRETCLPERLSESKVTDQWWDITRLSVAWNRFSRIITDFFFSTNFDGEKSRRKKC